ncbi:MAG: cytochrome c oxidase subunit II [Ignavibacteria bacterium]|nr:cytochrome c oxidase subunit II [Ignavibacteria bacterium]
MSEVSNFAKDVDGVFLFILGISLLLLVAITIAMVYFVIKYNRKKNPKPKNIEGNTKLEIIWTVIPTLLVLGMFWYGWIGYSDMSSAPKNAMVIEASARMWQWSFKYPNGKQSDSLFIPVDKPVKVDLQSLDVNHGFYIPAFRVKKDVIPNRNNFAWFKSGVVGEYDLFCSSYCGLQHSYMLTKVVVLPQNEFDDWYYNLRRNVKSDTTSVLK